MMALRRILLSFLILLLANCTPKKTPVAPDPGALRGAWVQGKSVLAKDEIDDVIRKAQKGGFKQIFVGVFGSGTTIFPSKVAEQKEDVEPGFDPLAYIVQEAHQRGIEVHAWFAVGRVADAKGNSVVIEKHPDWGLAGPDGQTMPWLNFTHPEVRKFVGDLMLEAVARGVDGVHFDYTRYPSAEWGFDDQSIRAFNAEHDFDLNELRYADLPAYGQFEGNALLMPTTAEVLAEFSNGFPAVLLNQYGNGQALIMNWQAAQRKTAVGSEILNRSIKNFLQKGGRVYILRSETTIAEYGEASFERAVNWLGSLGWDYTEILPEEMDLLEPESVLILPYVYLFSERDATRLANFVEAGGGAIFIDGPTRSMDREGIRAVTGMRPERRHFESWLLLTANSPHPLVPISDRPDEILMYEERHEMWSNFRMAGINALLKQVYLRIKAENPDVLVSVTITSDQRQALQENLQDWQAWLDEEYIDILIPRAYEETTDALRNTLEKWSYVSEEHDRLAFGLIAFSEASANENEKRPQQLVREIRMAVSSGSNGFMIFDLDHMTDAQLTVLANLEP